MFIDRRQFLAGAAATVAAAASIKATSKDLGSDANRWTEVRNQFDSLSSDAIHLSSFFLVSHPKPVREAIERHRRGIDNDPFTYVEQNIYTMPAAIQTAAAEYLGGKPEEVAITNSTTAGLALVYQGLKLRAGDEILTTTHDHFVHHESIRLAAKHSGARVRKVALFDTISKVSEGEIVARIKNSISARTRVVGVTWVHSSTGLKLPIKAIANMVAGVNRKRGEADRVLIVVDGVHGFGIEDESAAQMGVDFFAAGTHKWMFGPRGTGVLWGKSESWKHLDMVIPAFTMETFGAWMSGGEPAGNMRASWINHGGFRAFEYEWAIPAAFEFHKQLGRVNVAARIHELNDQCKEGLGKISKVKLNTPLGGKLSAGLVCFEVEGMRSAEVVKRLHEKKIIASTAPYWESYVRFAPSLVNTAEEIETAVRAVRELV